MNIKIVTFLIILTFLTACKSNQQASKINLSDRKKVELIAITNTKYEQIKKGMTLEQVQAIMGSQGQKNLVKSNLDRQKDEMFKVFWKDSKNLSSLFITIKNGKVISKIKS